MINSIHVADALRVIDLFSCAILLSMLVKILYQHFVYGRQGPYKSTIWIVASLLAFSAGGTYANVSRFGQPFKTYWIYTHIVGVLLAIWSTRLRDKELSIFHTQTAKEAGEHDVQDMINIHGFK